MSRVSEIRYTIRGEVAEIQLCAPQRLNALSVAMMGDLVDALSRAGREARAVLLSGEGRSFCSGVDLTSSATVPHPGLDGGAILEQHVNPMIEAIHDLPIPIVCAVQGAAAGLGMALALSCDIIVAERTAYFFAPFARIGLLPDGGIAMLLTRAVGRARATRVLMLADKLSAEEARDWGLITQIEEDEKMLETAREITGQLGKGPTVALGGIRRLVREASMGDLRSTLLLERELQRTIPATLDCQEGNAAFREKRAPRFVGQ